MWLGHYSKSNSTITIPRLRKRIHESLLNAYCKLNLSLYKAPCTRPTDVIQAGEIRMYGGLRSFHLGRINVRLCAGIYRQWRTSISLLVGPVYSIYRLRFY